MQSPLLTSNTMLSSPGLTDATVIPKRSCKVYGGPVARIWGS